MKRKGFRSTGLLLVALLLVLGILAGCGGNKATDANKSGDTKPSEGQTAEKPAENKDPVKVGAFYDLTGATGDVGTPYAEGEQAYIEYINSKGGVNGHQIELIGQDYAYKVDEALKLYKKYTTSDKVVAILGWGTGDTEAMKELVAKDKIPYLSASYSENLVNIEAHPYNFLSAATYSDQARSSLKWIKDNWKGEGNPKVALLYNSSPFGKSPIEDAKVFAKEIGVDIVDEEVVELKALDATPQLMNMQKKDPDFAIIQETWGATATILKDAKKLGLDTQFIGLNWASGEGIIPLAGDAAEGYLGVISHAFPYENLPALKEIEDYLASKGQKLADKNQKFVQGWVTAKILCEGIKNAGDNLTGEGIKAGLEKINNMDLGGLAAPVTFTADSHRGTKQIRLGEVKNGKFEMISDYVGY